MTEPHHQLTHRPQVPPPIYCLSSNGEMRDGALEAVQISRQALRENVELFLDCIEGMDPSNCGAAIASYGSLARSEFTGGSSDIDIFIIERDESGNVRRTFAQNHRSPSLLDLPEWSSVSQVKHFSANGLIERNQVLHLSFLAGDRAIIKEIREHQEQLDDAPAHFENIVFHRLYFDHYFPSRQGSFLADLKYSEGGMRSWMFLHWHGILKDSLNAPFQVEDDEQLPRVIRCLRSISEEANWSADFTTTLEQAASRLLEIKIKAPIETPTLSPEARTDLAALSFAVNHAWRASLALMTPIYGREIIEAIELVHGGEVPEDGLLRALREREDCPVSKIAFIWGTNHEQDPSLFREVAPRLVQDGCWSTLASLASSRHADAGLLDSLAERAIQSPGYGFIARMVAKHPAVALSTLARIAGAPALMWGHKEVAHQRLYGEQVG